jgi:hypothetical protein
MSTCGYGDILPIKNSEKYFAMALQLFGVALFPFMMSILKGIYSDKQIKLEERVKQRLDQLEFNLVKLD